MINKDLIKIFIDEIYHVDEVWSIDLADFSDYKVSNNKGFRYIFVIIDNFSKYLWAIPLKIKYSQTLTNEFSNISTTSKRKPLKLESDRGSEFHNSIFQNFLKTKNIHHYSRFTDKGPSIAERVIRTIRNFLKKPVFEKGRADWLSELLTEVIHDTIPSYRINYLPERYNERLLLPTKLSLDENNQVRKKLNLIQ